MNVMEVLSLNPTCTCPGDLSGDKNRDGADIQEFVHCLMTGGPECDCADVDADAALNSVDVTAFADILTLGGSCP